MDHIVPILLDVSEGQDETSQIPRHRQNTTAHLTFDKSPFWVTGGSLIRLLRMLMQVGGFGSSNLTRVIKKTQSIFDALQLSTDQKDPQTRSNFQRGRRRVQFIIFHHRFFSLFFRFFKNK